ncbi:MAG: aspartate kinase [Anaerolineaceae bacterium]|nr:aspartate kinase [Anaerolineaceae bacterium]
MQRITMKFGGTSVGSADAIRQVMDILHTRFESGSQVIAVVSAMAGVTDLLTTAAQAAAEGRRGVWQETARELRQRHAEVLQALVTEGAQREIAQREVDALVAEFEGLCGALTVVAELTPRVHDQILALGERLSSRVIATALCGPGVPARQYDATHLIVTDDHHQNANVEFNRTQVCMDRVLLPALERGELPVITGFIGRTPEGATTTLGRGGSDYSAALIAAACHCNELIIWTDVDGVMTTDPRIDPRARVLSQVSYLEVGELAFYGAKVLHPRTVQPVQERNIPLRVRNTFNPTHEGTLIASQSAPGATVIKAVTSVPHVGLLTVSGSGMMGVPGIAGRAFLATARVGANILMISQASSEQSFCFVVLDDRAHAVQHALQGEFTDEIDHRLIEHVELLEDVVILTAVGSGMRGTPGIAGRVFTTMGAQAINVVAIAQGASECSISFVVDEANHEKAVIALHELALEPVLAK